jgi:hypothetical protein
MRFSALSLAFSRVPSGFPHGAGVEVRLVACDVDYMEADHILDGVGAFGVFERQLAADGVEVFGVFERCLAADFPRLRLGQAIMRGGPNSVLKDLRKVS